MIRFYFHHTPNPMKVALFLEESNLPYEVIPVDIYKHEQHAAEYVTINPNAKVPAIIDGETIVFDSNAILLYLGENALDEFPHLKRWYESINSRPAVAKARAIGHNIQFKTAFDEETLRSMFPQNYLKV